MVNNFIPTPLFYHDSVERVAQLKASPAIPAMPTASPVSWTEVVEQKATEFNSREKTLADTPSGPVPPALDVFHY